MPFTCSVENGRLRVEPAVEQSYAFVGGRDQQPFTYCPVGDAGRCRTWMVHRFVVQCAGGRATWPEIVASAAARSQQRANIEGGQLMLRMGASRGDPAERWCYDGDRIPGRALPGQGRCGQTGYGASRNAMRTHILALPRGYAPLDIVGARLLIDAEPTRTLATAKAPIMEPVAPVTASAPTVAAIATLPSAPAVTSTPTVTVEPLEPLSTVPLAEGLIETVLAPETTTVPAPLPAPAVPVPTAAPAPWKPWIEITPANAAQEEAVITTTDGMARFIAMLLLATASLFVTGALLRRRNAFFGRREKSTAAAGAGEAPRAVALRSKAEGQIASISGALDRLSTVAPLRNALARDLQASERRFAVVVAGISAPDVEPDAWSRARRRLERIAQDLDRLQQIADSAVSSLYGLRAQTKLPRSKDEAYATLGVTPGVSEPILKKLVEALRISWHPDLARNDEERAERDIRIKEINVAWDLITGKRLSE